MDVISALFNVEPFLAKDILAKLDLNDLQNVAKVSLKWSKIIPDQVREKMRLHCCRKQILQKSVTRLNERDKKDGKKLNCSTEYLKGKIDKFLARRRRRRFVFASRGQRLEEEKYRMAYMISIWRGFLAAGRGGAQESRSP